MIGKEKDPWKQKYRAKLEADKLYHQANALYEKEDLDSFYEEWRQRIHDWGSGKYYEFMQLAPFDMVGLPNGDGKDAPHGHQIGRYCDTCHYIATFADEFSKTPWDPYWRPDWERLHDEDDVYTGPRTWTGKIIDLQNWRWNVITNFCKNHNINTPI